MIASLIATMTLAVASIPVFAALPKSQMIAESKAKQIAVDDAGVKMSAVNFTKVHLDTDDGKLEYDIDFNAGKTEFDYDIDARTGKILSAEKDINENFVPPAKVENSRKKSSDKKADTITKEKALKIAMKDAGIPQKDISYSEVETDNDDGVNKYEVVIRKGDKEYSYDIAVKDGSILEHEVDIDA